MREEIKKTSVIFTALGYFYLIYKRLAGVYGGIYRESRFYTWKEKISRDAEVYFKNSFLPRLIFVAEENNHIDIFSSSKFYQRIHNLGKKVKGYPLGTSRLFQTKYSLTQELRSLPVRTISLILIISILVNSLALLVFGNTIGLTSWLWRAILFILGLIGLSVGVDLKTLEENSFFLKILRK